MAPGQPLMRAGFAICDTIGGMTAALAVSSALYQRTHTGRGQFVDVAMLDAALAFIPGPVSEYTVAGIEQKQIGNGSVSRKPTASRFRAWRRPRFSSGCTAGMRASARYNLRIACGLRANTACNALRPYRRNSASRRARAGCAGCSSGCAGGHAASRMRRRR